MQLLLNLSLEARGKVYCILGIDISEEQLDRSECTSSMISKTQINDVSSVEQARGKKSKSYYPTCISQHSINNFHSNAIAVGPPAGMEVGRILSS